MGVGVGGTDRKDVLVDHRPPAALLCRHWQGRGRCREAAAGPWRVVFPPWINGAELGTWA